MIKLITLNWNGKDKLIELKNSILPALEYTGRKWSWLIRDHGSKDGSVDEIKSWNNDNINCIAYKHNLENYSQGMNFLFKESGAKGDDLVFTLNNDVVFNDKYSLKHMIDIIERDNDVGLVGAKLKYKGTNKIQHAGVLFHPTAGLPFHYRGGVEAEERDDANRLFPIVTGAVCLTKANYFDNLYANNKSNIRGFCELYSWAFDDVDFSMRILHDLKKKVVYCGKTDIFHEESATLKKNPVNKLFANQNAKIFMESWNDKIDMGLVEKYTNDPDYNLYEGKDK